MSPRQSRLNRSQAQFFRYHRDEICQLPTDDTWVAADYDLPNGLIQKLHHRNMIERVSRKHTLPNRYHTVWKLTSAVAHTVERYSD